MRKCQAKKSSILAMEQGWIKLKPGIRDPKLFSASSQFLVKKYLHILHEFVVTLSTEIEVNVMEPYWSGHRQPLQLRFRPLDEIQELTQRACQISERLDTFGQRFLSSIVPAELTLHNPFSKL